MGMPGMNMSFSEKASTVVKRGEKGIVALILKDKIPSKNPLELIPGDSVTGLTADNKKQIELAMMGYVNPPKKVLAYVIGTDAEDYEEAFTAYDVLKWDYLVSPTCETDGQTQAVVSYIKSRRSSGKMVKAVLPNTAADNEGIINYTTESVTDEDGTTYTTEQYCARIAGIIAGTPLSIACTYAPLTELSDCKRLPKSQMDTAVENGQLIVYHDGEKVKVARGVNSLTTVTAEKGDKFKKIKIVETMDIIKDDITKTVEDSYLGKYPNTYDNKCLLVSVISNYFNTLIRENVLSSASVEIDVVANKTYLQESGIDTSDMSDDDLKRAATGDKVFLKAKITILDAIEEITLPITI